MKKNNSNKRHFILFAVWGTVMLTVVVIFIIASFTSIYLLPSTYYLVIIIVNFASFLATSFFGISIYSHNASIRDQNAEIRNQTIASNRRAEAFRNLQFISSNYSIIDFVDNMLIYEEFSTYTQKLKASKEFDYYLLEKGITKEEVMESFDDFTFLTVKLPIEVIEGIKTLSRLKLRSFKFVKQDSEHRFLPPEKDSHSHALILFNEKEHRSEAVVNLIMRKDGDFYRLSEPNKFLKIKIRLEMESLLGVNVLGAIELYFTNPEKLEKDGASKYKINSSQFELQGMPRLVISKEFNPD